MRRPTIMQHGPWRRWWAPWTLICRCGMGAHPCYASQMLKQQKAMFTRPAWNMPTATMPARTAPLLTPGQAARSNPGSPR